MLQPANLLQNLYRVQLKKISRRKLQFIRIRSIFYYKILYDYSQGLSALLVGPYTFYKILLIYIIEMAGSEIQSMIFESHQPAMQNT